MVALHVPDDMIEDIYSRMPVKSLLRFKTTSKKWYSLLSQNHEFANFHLKLSNSHLIHYANRPIIFQTRICVRIFQSLNIDTNETRHSIRFPIGIDTGCQLIGSANGLVCVAGRFKGDCFIWNPCTNECKKILVPLSVLIPCDSNMIFGFGYDCSSDDYKIVACWDLCFRVFSLKRNSWKIFKDCNFISTHKSFHLNGALHWCRNKEIVAFDLAEDVFFSIELPEELKVLNSRFLYDFRRASFWEYKGLLCLARGKSIWVMKKYRDGKSWVKLSKLFLVDEYKTPLGISALGEVVYQVECGTGFVKSDIQGNISDYEKSWLSLNLGPSAFVYTESLISPKCFDGLQTPSKKMIKRPKKQRKTQ